MKEQEIKQAKELLIRVLRFLKKREKIHRFRTVKVQKTANGVKFIVRVWNGEEKKDTMWIAERERVRTLDGRELDWVALLPPTEFL